MADMGVIVWKEWKELLLARGNLRGGLWNALFSLGIFGVVLPLQFGQTWLDSLWTVFWVLFVSSFWTTSLVADSFAGERERHTLETLLASRLPNPAILLGKLAALVGYVWGQVLASLLVGVVTLNLVQWQGRIVFYRGSVALGATGLSLLGAGLVAGLGVLISLRAASVRQAQQRLLIPVTIVMLLPSLGVMILPAELQARVLQLLVDADATAVILAAMAALLAVDSALVAAALARFQRSKLILD